MEIERNFHKYLHSLVVDKLSNNTVAKTIALHYNRLNKAARDSFFESVLPLYTRYNESEFQAIKFNGNTSGDTEKRQQKDFRLKSIRLSNVRGIPASKNNLKYGFDLSSKDIINNLVLLGPNGTGKSSIYGALEYIYTHRISEKDLRTYDPYTNSKRDFLDYLSHFNFHPECEIETMSGRYTLASNIFNEDELSYINPSTHFLSDYDTYSKGQIEYNQLESNNSFHLLVANNLGLQEYLNFSGLLLSVSSYRRQKEATRRRNLQQNLESTERNISVNLDELTSKKERVNFLKTNSIPTSTTQYPALKLTISKLRLTTLGHIEYSENYKVIFDRYREEHARFIGLSVNPNLQKEAQFLLLSLELIDQSDACPLCHHSTLSVNDIKRDIQERLQEITEYQTSLKNLEAAIQNVSLTSQNISNRLYSISQQIKSEISAISSYPQLSELSNYARELSDFTDEKLTHVDSLQQKVNDLLKSKQSLITNNEELFDSLSPLEVSLYVELPLFDKAIDVYLDKRRLFLDRFEATISENPTNSTIEEIAILESEIMYHEKIILTLQSECENYRREIIDLTDIINAISKIKEEAFEFSTVLENDVNRIVANAFRTVKDTILSVLQDYLNEEQQVKLDIYLKQVPNKADPDVRDSIIVAEVHQLDALGNTVSVLSPNKFFNTFRYRTFCMMVSISLAIALRKSTGINLPLIIDDVFYASDYNSKSTFRTFIANVLRLFKKFNNEMPLQFIILSHDELVFDCAIDAISELESDYSIESYNEDPDIPIFRRTLFARLFSASDVDQNPSNSPFGNFWDLTYTMPTEIQLQLITEGQTYE